MKKYAIHIIIWGIGVAICLVLAAFGSNLIYNVAILWSMCALYFFLYYLSLFLKRKKTKIAVNKTGVFSGRAFGIFVNMFVLEYILELYQHIHLCGILLICSMIVLFWKRKDVIPFFSENDWKFTFYGIYIAFNVLFSCINSAIGYCWEETLLVNVEEVTLGVKILLMLVYVIVSILSVIPDSCIMKIATKNEWEN